MRAAGAQPAAPARRTVPRHATDPAIRRPAVNPRRLPGFSAFYRSCFVNFAQQHRALARSGITLLQASQLPHATLVPAVGDWRLTQTRAGTALLRRDLAGVRQEGRKPIGAFSLSPPGVAMPVEVLGPHTVRALAVEAARLETHFCAVGAPGGAPLDPLLTRLALHDAEIARLLDRFWSEAEQPDPLARLLADGMLQMLAGCLLRLAGYRAVEPDPRALAPRRLRRALDLIEQRLAEDIGLAEIAAAAGLSPHHFARAFRAATGMPPYRYLTHRRIERAKQLMAQTDACLAQIAFDCGFGSQGQFTTTFTRLSGISPGRWRAAKRG
jgi:AraC-like DNA-binding protein